MRVPSTKPMYNKAVLPTYNVLNVEIFVIARQGNVSQPQHQALRPVADTHCFVQSIAIYYQVFSRQSNVLE